VKVLILHGLLHLAGYDHETDSDEMLAHETAMRQELKLPVGLIERTHAAAAKAAEAARKPKSAPKKAAARSATVGKKAATSKSKPGSATKSASAETRKRGGRRA
jgi:probable rRNA maturation factor